MCLRWVGEEHMRAFHYSIASFFALPKRNPSKKCKVSKLTLQSCPLGATLTVETMAERERGKEREKEGGREGGGP